MRVAVPGNRTYPQARRQWAASEGVTGQVGASGPEGGEEGCQVTTVLMMTRLEAGSKDGATETPEQGSRGGVEHAEAQGWRIKPVRGHAWGRMYCPWNDDDCRCGEVCIAIIWTTPRNPANHARQIRRVMNGCTGGSSVREE